MALHCQIALPRGQSSNRILEYKKGESQTNVEIMNEEDFNSLLRQEEEKEEEEVGVAEVRGFISHLY